MPGEFDLINQYFSNTSVDRDDVILAGGDDCAIVDGGAIHDIAISTDSLVCGTHFLEDAKPEWVAHKALVSNLSDLAAMGASPAWVSLALTLPDFDSHWLERFSQAFHQVAKQYNLQLIGGDTTKGPLAITLTIQGLLPKGSALKRTGAKPGDKIFVSGCLGDSKAGLDIVLDSSKRVLEFAPVLLERHFVRVPQIDLGQQLLSFASSAIDISDGLISDLAHITKFSQCGARLSLEALPTSNELKQFLANDEREQQYALTSGEEYQLCFTVPENQVSDMLTTIENVPVKVTEIGEIIDGTDLQLFRNGQEVDLALQGFDHFRVVS